MVETKKTWIEEIKGNWRETPNSVKFWNGLVLLGLVISGVIGIDLLLVELAIMSVFVCVMWFDSIGEEGKYEKHLWVWLTPLVWGLVILCLTIYGCIKLYENTISKFNNWLDKQK